MYYVGGRRGLYGDDNGDDDGNSYGGRRFERPRREVDNKGESAAVSSAVTATTD